VKVTVLAVASDVSFARFAYDAGPPPNADTVGRALAVVDRVGATESLQAAAMKAALAIKRGTRRRVGLIRGDLLRSKRHAARAAASVGPVVSNTRTYVGAILTARLNLGM